MQVFGEIGKCFADLAQVFGEIGKCFLVSVWNCVWECFSGGEGGASWRCGCGVGVERGCGVVGRVGERVAGARTCGQRFIGSYKNAPRRKPVARRSHPASVARHPSAALAANATTAALGQTRGSPNDTKGAAIPTQPELQQKQPLAVSAIGARRKGRDAPPDEFSVTLTASGRTATTEPLLEQRPPPSETRGVQSDPGAGSQELL